MEYKELTAEEARELSSKREIKDSVQYEKLMTEYRKQIYLSIEKEAEAGRLVTHLSFPRKKEHVNQVIEAIRDDLQKQGYDVILQKGMFTQILTIAW